MKIKKLSLSPFLAFFSFLLLIFLQIPAFAISGTVTSEADSRPVTLRQMIADDRHPVYFASNVGTIHFLSPLRIKDSAFRIEGNSWHRPVLDGQSSTGILQINYPFYSEVGQGLGRKCNMSSKRPTGSA